MILAWLSVASAQCPVICGDEAICGTTSFVQRQGGRTIFEGADLTALWREQGFHVRIRVHRRGGRTALAPTPQDPPAFACP